MSIIEKTIIINGENYGICAEVSNEKEEKEFEKKMNKAISNRIKLAKKK